MPVRSAQARWEKTLKEGKGKLRTESGVVDAPYTFRSRFEEGQETNPEELLGAALAGCFSMALANQLAQSGHVADHVHTTARMHLEKEDGGMAITRADLVTEAIVPGVDPEEFQRIAESTRTGCIVSRALSAIEISLEARLGE